ncbi:hypothetical protein ABZ401_11760 [Streptomyces sp. NPDC005892]|uniref:hypothetical protein n=1 Tax=Streptomyces sp. NPDC005892 TaxID=3155593 RepID=UPI0033C605B7
MKIVGLGRAGRVTAAVGLVVVLGAGAGACGSDGDAGDSYMSADKVCDGLFEGPLAKKVERITATTEFSDNGDEGLEKVAKALKAGYGSGHSWGKSATLCELSPKEREKVTETAELSFFMYAPQDIEDLRTAPGTVTYTMGKRSEARGAGASIYLECVSSQLKGSSTNPLRIYGGFSNKTGAAKGTGDDQEINMEILHAGALSVVKKLDCENNAGLPETPVLTTK